jgi:hypothetical protein
MVGVADKMHIWIEYRSILGGPKVAHNSIYFIGNYSVEKHEDSMAVERKEGGSAA